MTIAACLDDDTIAGLVEGRLDAEAVRAATAHVDECGDCRSLLAEVVRSLEPAGAARSAFASSSASSAARARGLALPEGATVGRYVVLECIGSGAMGIVYTARDPDLGRRVALKLLRTDPSDSASHQQRARLLREAQATAKLSHPSVVTIYDVGVVGDEVFLAMELVDGGTLRDWMRERRPWREVVDVMRRAGEGLEAAHDAGLVHRDFKPDNVLVGRDGRVRVTDFGLARASGPHAAHAAHLADGDDGHTELSASLTRTGAFVGTPAYTAPEQGDKGLADARSDVFGYCVTFYEALYGERPFAGDTLPELAAAIRAGTVRAAPRESHVPAWLRRVLLQGLRPDPKARPESVRAVLDAIEAGLSGARRRSLGFAMGGAVVGAGVLIAAFATRSGSAPPAAAPVTAPPRPTSVIDLPMPPSSNADALRAYARGLQGMRDGTWGAFDFEHAAQLDPAMAAAHLRYAMLQFWQFPTEGREHLAKAIAGASTLTDHDLAILGAARAWMQAEPSDDAAFVRLIDEARARYPMDAELAYYAGFAETQVADHVESVARLDRAIALDPGFAAAYQLKADEQAYAGDLEGALATIAVCVERAPEATRCLMERGFLDEANGDCAQLEEDGRRMQAHDPASDMSYLMMAMAAYGRGKPLEVVQELLRQNEDHARGGERERFEAKHKYVLAALAGDFDGARRWADALRAAVGASPDRRLRAGPALMTAAAFVESGRALEAAHVARDFLQREQAWAPDPRSDDFAVLRDSTPSFWEIERRAGLLADADFDELRGQWFRGWEARLPRAYLPYAWLHGFARVAETPADAGRALAELANLGAEVSAVPAFTPLTFGDAFVGKTYALAGRAADALPYLRRAARSCLALDQPFEHTETHLLLGQALTATGAPREEACAAYGVVLGRWGKATPRSVTAERARTLSAALGCK